MADALARDEHPEKLRGMERVRGEEIGLDRSEVRYFRYKHNRSPTRYRSLITPRIAGQDASPALLAITDPSLITRNRGVPDFSGSLSKTGFRSAGQLLEL